MIKTSVKKPLTVFVAVVVVLMLGIISYTKMTPDLMPNIDMPYVLVTTAYPGASPEKVETEVTKPLERTLGTLENIKNVTSTSNENYSMVVLEFTDAVNMDSITVDILQKISTVEGNFDEMVATPTIMKINPNMLPVMVAAIDVEGMNNVELSNFVKDEVLSKLEGTEGVVNVTANGLLNQRIDIKVSDEKIKQLNAKISGDLTAEFDEKEAQLNSSAAEIEAGKAKVEQGKKELQKAQDEFADKMLEAADQLDQKELEIEEGKLKIQEQIQFLDEQIVQLQIQQQSLIATKNTIDEINAQEIALKNSIKLISDASNGYNTAKAELDGFNAQIDSINNDTSLSADEKTQAINAIKNSDDYKKAVVDVEKFSAVFDAYGITAENADTTLEILNASLSMVQTAKDSITSALESQGLKESDIDAAVEEIDAGIVQLEKAQTTLYSTLEQLDDGKIQLEEAMKTLEKEKTSAILQFSSTSATLLVTSANLDAAKMQIEQGKVSFEQAKDTALKNADLTKLITKSMVSNILMAQNFSMPAGYVQSEGKEYTVTVGDEYNNIEDIKNQVLFDLQLEGVDPIYISDIAQVEFADNSADIYAKVNKNNGVVLSFQKQSTYATAEVSDNLAEKFSEIEAEYKGVHFLTLMDQGDYIYMITDSLMESLIYGAIFAVLILFLFLKDIKPTIITLCSIPLSVLFAIVLMYFSGISINMMSLSGLAIAVGMLVDNSVVVIENIYRLKSLGMSSIKAAVSGAKQVTGAIAASTLTTICVFLPIVFVEGITRQLFVDMALTITYSLLASLVVAITLVPSMGSRMLRNTTAKPNKTLDKLTEIYRKLLDKSLSHKIVVIAVSVVLLIATCTVSYLKGFIFLPETDSNQISVNLTMPKDSKFEDTKAQADKVLEKILSVESVQDVGAMTSDNKTVSFYVILKEDAELSGAETAERINQLCKDSVGEVQALSSDMSAQMSTLSGKGVAIKVFGEDSEQLQKTADDMKKYISSIDGIKSVDNGIGETNPAVKITIDKNEAMKNGLTVAQVFQEVSGALKTDINSTSVNINSDSYTVNITDGESEYKELEYIEDYVITTKDAQGNEKKVALIDIADIEKTLSPVSINRENQKRIITVTAEIEEGENITLINDKVEDKLNEFKTPDGIEYKLDGENESIMDSIYDLMTMLLIGIALVYLVMVAQFQSLKSPFIVMFTIPLALTGGLGGLILTNQEISVVSMMGFILLCGIIVNNGIVLVDYINNLRIEGKEKREAIIEAGVTRIRPILMTSITTILGLVVMALGTGTGADIMQPIAVVCIGGLLYATLLTLFVIPIIYDIMNRKDLKTIDEKELEYTDK